MKRKALATMMAAAMVLSMVGCGGAKTDSTASTTTTEKTEAAATEAADSAASADATVENKDKPLCWFNRQPSSSATGELDKEALNFNGNTYYVGFDANQGAELQGQMVLDYIKENAETIDRNGDGVIGYVLAIGDIGHNDSIARTRGVRSSTGNRRRSRRHSRFHTGWNKRRWKSKGCTGCNSGSRRKNIYDP